MFCGVFGNVYMHEPHRSTGARTTAAAGVEVSSSVKLSKQFEFWQRKLEQYCDICQAYVKENTKHCKNCDRLRYKLLTRCCEDFDHHCKWINNCVGGLNYKSFMVMVSSTMLQFSYSLVLHLRIISEI